MLVQVEHGQRAAIWRPRKLSPGIVEKFGSRFLARGSRTATLGGRAGAGQRRGGGVPELERAQEFLRLSGVSGREEGAGRRRDGAVRVVEGM